MKRGEPLFYQWIDLGGLVAYLYRYLVQILGTLFFFLAGKAYLNHPIKWLNFFARKSLGIYAVHFHVLGYAFILANTSYYALNLFIEWCIALTATSIVVFIISQIKYVRLLLIGER